MDPERLRAVFDRLERHIEERWQVPVRIRDVPNPFTGDLDGREIVVDHDLEIEEALFILVHLFGHTVQLNVSEAARRIASTTREPGAWSAEELGEVASYEAEACRYSLQLLHDCGIHDLDQWLADFAACDVAYLMHFYRTGEKRPVRELWTDGNPRLPPLAIPEFHPTRWISRFDGIVI